MTNEQMRQRIAELEEEIREMQSDLATVFANLDWLREITGADLEDEDAQMVGAARARFRDRRTSSLLSASPPASEPDADVVERVARFVYEHRNFGKWMPGYANKPAWVDGGNSNAQQLARDFASAALSAMRPAIDRGRFEAALSEAMYEIGGLYSCDMSLTIHDDVREGVSKELAGKVMAMIGGQTND